MTARDTNSCTKNGRWGIARHVWLLLVLLLSWVGCYSPLPSREHVCLSCASRCPGGLVCHENRCLPSCESGCAEGEQCQDGVCLPPSGEPQCEVSIRLNACVGRPVESQVMGAADGLVILDSTLPDGLQFDASTGRITGTPERESTGTLSVRPGDNGGPETTVDITATVLCANIVTARIEWCAGRDESHDLQASDNADYEWQFSGLPTGVNHDGPTLSGNIAQPQTYAIDVTLVEDGTVRGLGRLELVVVECKEPPDDPDAGAEGGAPAPLRIETTHLGEICEAASYASKPLQASGGDGQYQWSLEGDSQGFSIDADTGVLSASAPASGHVELTVRVDDGAGATDSESVTIDVLPSEDGRCGGGSLPVTVENTTLANACAGKDYTSIPLVASGGDGVYTWSLINPPDWLSIDVETNSLVGTPPAAETLQIDVRVVDGKGAEDQATLTLEVRAGSDPACGQIILQITTDELADACIGEPYVQTLSAIGGTGGYEWAHNAGLPPGLTIQASGRIVGTVAGSAEPGVYDVEFRVDSGIITPAVSKTLPLRVGSCGTLVFIGEDTVTGRLLVTRPPYTSVRELSEGLLGAGETVISFRKSSSSSKLAFLVGSATGSTPARLYMADALTGEVRALQWPAQLGANPSVLDYVWSIDGTYVGVVASTAQQTVLAAVLGETGVLSEPVSIGSYRGELLAVEERLCYLVAGVPDQSDLLCNTVAGGVVSAINRREGGFSPRLIEGGQFIAGEQSYLAILGPQAGPFGQGEYHDLLSGSIFPSIDHVFSPTLRWAAGLNFDGDQFELIVSEPDLESEDPIQLAPLPDCEAIVAWSKDERTLVCQGSEDVRVFQLEADGSVRRSFGIEDSAGHVIGEVRRVISEDGRWFAYDGGQALYLADLSAPTPTSILLHDQSQSQASLYSGLALDSAQGRLFYHHASELRAIALETRAAVPLNGSELLSDPPSCRLNYLVAPDLWCGADTIPATFFPSPEGDEVAFLSTSRQLHVIHLGKLQDGPRHVTQLPVKCSRPDGGIRCSENIAWVRRN